MIKLKLVAAAIISAASACSVVNAETKVIGQVNASPSAMVASTTVGKESVAYLQGDKVVTGADATASINLATGKATFVAAPNTIMQVVDSANGEVALNNGAVNFTAAQNFPVSFTTAAGTFKVSADKAFDAVALAEGDKFALVAKSSDLFVESQSGVVSKVSVGEAFSLNGASEVVDVQLLTGFSFLGLSGFSAIGAAVSVVAIGAIAIDEVTEDDDDDEASPN